MWAGRGFIPRPAALICRWARRARGVLIAGQKKTLARGYLMGRRTDPDPARQAEIDAALQAFFDALAGRPTPLSFQALIDQLERQSSTSGSLLGDSASRPLQARRSIP